MIAHATVCFLSVFVVRKFILSEVWFQGLYSSAFVLSAFVRPQNGRSVFTANGFRLKSRLFKKAELVAECQRDIQVKGTGLRRTAFFQKSLPKHILFLITTGDIIAVEKYASRFQSFENPTVKPGFVLGKKMMQALERDDGVKS